MTNSVWRFAMAGQLQFGRGASHFCGSTAAQLAIRKPLVVTDQNLIRSGLLDPILQSLENHCQSVTLFDGGQAEPPVQIARDAVSLGRQHENDGVIGVGGGSNLDVAKVTALVLRHGGQPEDYFGFQKVPGPILPLIAIPTTAGTGSEVSHSAVLTDPMQKIKVSTLSPWLRPAAALVDPSLTDSCPSTVSAHSGIDALVHAVEAFTAKDFRLMPSDPSSNLGYEGAHPLGDLLAREAIQAIAANLPHVLTNPTPVSRDAMAWAALLAGMAFSNCGVGLVHALEYPVGASCHCSHGEGNGLLLPHVLRFLLPAREERLAEIATLFGAKTGSQQQLAGEAIDRIEALAKQCGLRMRLRDLGVN
ncbi:MAG: iron-containing alcohol dehydrogenase, partial [Pirellulaceae bacterium]